MKVLRLLWLLPLIFLQVYIPEVHAQSVLSASTSTSVSLSDAIYADLAVRGDLDNVSVFYSDGKAANNVLLNETRHWLPASTVKLFAAMYAYKLIADGKLHLSDTVTIDAKNEVPTELVTDELPTLLIGDTVTLDRLIRQMITQSDNTAYNQLLDLLGRDNITAYIQSLGFTQSHVGSKLNLDDSQTQYEYDVPGFGINSTTAADYAKAFTLIQKNKIAGSKELFVILSGQKINNMIPLYLPKTVVCAHKTGDLDPLYHDGGICQDKVHSYVLTIFTNAGDPNLLAHLSEIVYTKNYQLVGKSVTTPTPVSVAQPLDQLVLNPPKTSVLGAATINFPVPDITAADLGVKAADLSLVLPDSKLPHVIIPADSPFHALSNFWQLAKFVTAPNAQSRMDVVMQIAKLRIAEAKDLQHRGQPTRAQANIEPIQSVLNVISKDPLVKSNAADQIAIQTVSETRFAFDGQQLEQTGGEAKLRLIKQIANQVKQNLQVQKNIPEAINATSPTQKPLIGTVVTSTPTTITIQTAGGQQITVPTNTTAIPLQQKLAAMPTVTPQEAVSPTVSPSISTILSPTPTPSRVVPGTTVALIGSTVDNHFAPSLIVTNVPKEIAAPQPVVVAKIDTKHNTMVVEENGVYTQVDINKDTSIKAADTDIPLKSIQQGDVVVVHGAPLTQTQETPPTQGISPTVPTEGGVSPTAAISTTGAPTSQSTTVTTTITPTKSVISTPVTGSAVSPTNSLIPSVGKSVSITPVTSVKPSTVSSSPVVPTVNPPKTPPVIQSTSIQAIEKKADITSTPVVPQSKPSAPSNPPVQQSQPQQPAKSAPAQPQPTTAPTTADKKK